MRGLGYLHRLGLIHGNLKPSNMLVLLMFIQRTVNFLQSAMNYLKRGEAAAGVYAAPEVLRKVSAPLLYA